MSFTRVGGEGLNTLPGGDVSRSCSRVMIGHCRNRRNDVAGNIRIVPGTRRAAAKEGRDGHAAVLPWPSESCTLAMLVACLSIDGGAYRVGLRTRSKHRFRMFFRQDMSQSNKTSWVDSSMLPTPDQDKDILITDTGAPLADNSRQRLCSNIAAAMQGAPKGLCGASWVTRQG